MARAFVAVVLFACFAGSGAALAQTRYEGGPARRSVNSAQSVAIPRNVEPSCSVTREQVLRSDGRLQWQTRTDCIRDPY